ncbi:MAG: photosystem II biogenesis protein Psp29 [Elainellaceae cyanobacterium]
MSNVRTVSDTKRAFYTFHTRPIASIYRRVVEELMVEMHLLSVNVDFRYDPIYALGVVTAFDRFMEGYRPDRDKQSIFSALCRAIGADGDHYRRDAEQLKAEAENLSRETLEKSIELPSEAPDTFLKSQIEAIAHGDTFKYSRLFTIGLYAVVEAVDLEFAKDAKSVSELLKKLGSTLNFSPEKLEKDLEVYRSNLEKLIQTQAVLADIMKADRKKREERAAQAQATESTESESEEPAKPEQETQETEV